MKIDPKNEKPTSEKESSLPLRQGIKREIVAWFWVALAFMLINGTVGQARVIPSGSMENTLLIGDHLIMSRVGYDAGVPFTNWHVPLWRNPDRQQMIIFKPPYAPDTTDLIKRTIALPGDTIDLRNGTVYINGREFNEPYTVGLTEPAPPGSAPRGYTDIKFPFHVPDNCYFAMGDNRTNPERHHRHARNDLHVAGWTFGRLAARANPRAFSHLRQSNPSSRRCALEAIVPYVLVSPPPPTCAPNRDVFRVLMRLLRDTRH